MAIFQLPQHSLKTRLTLVTLTIFLISLWSLSFFTSRMLHKDFEKLLGEQQLSTATIVATQINRELETRIEALKNAAALAGPAMQEGPASIQAFLEQRAELKILFNKGSSVTGKDGIRIAHAPFSADRIGSDMTDRDYFDKALHEGKTSVGRPVIGKASKVPVVIIGTPIHDSKGSIIGVLAGVIDLESPSFLDQIPQSHYGKTGGFILIARESRLIVTATEKGRIMSPLQTPGKNPVVDRYVKGVEGTAVYVNSRGEEVLTSARSIPAADWLIIITSPTAEVFAPVRDMQQGMLMTTLALMLLAGILIWWSLTHQLMPLRVASELLSAQSQLNATLYPLPIKRQDEIGTLIGGFNNLLETLRLRENMLKKIMDTASVAIFLVKLDGKIIQANQRMADMFGIPLKELEGIEYLALVHPEEREQARQTILANLHRSSHSIALDRRYWRADHSEFWGHLTGNSFYAPNGEHLGLVGVISDITERKEHEKQLQHIAHYDVLTTLPNRVLLADRLRQAMAQADRRTQLLAVAYLDIDGFKFVNDNYGHQTGDRLLITLAERMKHSMRECDTLARLGGDEFVAILVDIESAASCVPMLLRLLDAASQVIAVDGTDLQVSASLGVTFYPQTDAVDPDQLFRQADHAMYQAKLSGKNRYHVFDAVLDRNIRGHHESLEHIRRGLTAGEFVLYYQPKVNMRSGEIIGAEALVRWRHPEHGLLSPAAFLPALEGQALANELGQWVIAAALKQVLDWRKSGIDMPVSVNVSASELQQIDFVDRLRQTLKSHPGIRPGNLEIEVLETSALEDLARISGIIEQCQSIGVSFSLDDFGTGYSSLTYLKHLPVSQLKIDQSFVRDMLDDPDDLSILGGVLSLATAFGRQVIAEGVETAAHGTMLLQLGCELAQGYGIAHPMPGDEFPAWVRNWRPDPAWGCVPLVDHEDLPLLFAIVEHRAWIIALDEYLKGKRDTLPLVHHECRFAHWLEKEGRALHGQEPAFQVLTSVHRQVHALANEVCAIHAKGQNALALSRLPELDALRDLLIEHLALLTLKRSVQGDALSELCRSPN